MTRFDASELHNGIYRLHWKSGGFSLAAVGRLHDGTTWYAPTNWTAADQTGIACTDWRKVDHVERIAIFGKSLQEYSA